MSAWGLTPEGFVAPTFDDVREAYRSSFRAALGQSIDVTPAGPLGQMIDILSNADVAVWEAAQDLDASFSPDGATGARLEAVSAITGTLRQQATFSKVTLLLVGTSGTTVLTGKQASVVATESVFTTTADATLAAVGAWVAATPYVEGDLRSNSGNVYRCTSAGTSAGSGGPSGTGSSISDNSVTWAFLGSGNGAVSVAAQAAVGGPVVGAAGTITQIVTPVGGWSAVTNLLDATEGVATDTDAALRIRREGELRGASNAAADAIRAAVLKVTDVVSCVVFVNDTDSTNADGVPPHAFECLVVGGVDADIAAAVFASGAAGIKAYGTTTVSVTDSAGNAQSVSFSRPTNVPIYVRIDALVDAVLFPADGAAEIKQAVIDFGDTSKVGKDAVSASLGAQAFKVAGVLDTTHVYISVAPSPTLPTTIAIGPRQLATYDTSRVTVNVTPGTP